MTFKKVVRDASTGLGSRKMRVRSEELLGLMLKQLHDICMCLTLQLAIVDGFGILISVLHGFFNMLSRT